MIIIGISDKTLTCASKSLDPDPAPPKRFNREGAIGRPGNDGGVINGVNDRGIAIQGALLSDKLLWG